MTAWEIKFYVLACDHFDEPDVPALLGSDKPLTLNFDKPQRCTARFKIRELSRARLRREAAKDGWVHVRRPGRPYATDGDYCPKHAAEGRAGNEKERLETEAFYASTHG